MQTRTRRAYRQGLTVGMAATMFVLLVASIAWACTSQPVIGPPGSNTAGSGLDPNFGPPNLFPVKVEGSAFQSGPVSIRWNSVEGHELATPNGPNFSVQIRIPADASPGVFYVIAFQRDALGNISSMARAPFEVTPVQSPRASGESSGVASGATESSSTGGDTSLTTEGGQESHSSDQIASTAESVPSRGSGSRPAESANRDLSGSAAPAPAAPGAAVSTPELESGGLLSPSSRTLTSDLWSGFAKGNLLPGLPQVTPSDRLPSGLIVGTAFLGLGIIALIGGFGLAEVHRRRTARA